MSQARIWKGDLVAYAEGGGLYADQEALCEAGRKNLCDVMNSTDASHTISISKDKVVVAGAYLNVTEHQCFDDDGGGVIDGGQTIQEIMDDMENFGNDDGDTFDPPSQG